MKPVRIAEDIVPIATFKARAATWLKRAADTGQPVVITQNGKPAGVLLSPSEYDRISEQQRFVESVARGEEEVKVQWTDWAVEQLGAIDRLQYRRSQACGRRVPRHARWRRLRGGTLVRHSLS